MLVSALSTSFIVALSHSVGNDSLSGLAGFVLASGLASLLGGVVSGRLSDISSRRVMSIGAAIASALLILIVTSAQFLPQQISFYLLPIGFFAINLVHTGIRVARKTYVVDMAEGDQRTLYVARSAEHTSELQSRGQLVCRLLLEKKKQQHIIRIIFDMIRHI